MYRKELKSKVDRTMPIVPPNAAAIDVGATMHMAAVGPDHALEPVRNFGTFTADLDHVPGRKTDVSDAQWLQRLHSFGLLRARFLPKGGLRSGEPTCVSASVCWSTPPHTSSICKKHGPR